MKADLIITNANILTLDHQNSKAHSITVKNRYITGIWRENAPPKHEVSLSKSGEVIDAKGATVIPGFIDTHNHLAGFSQYEFKVNCRSPKNKTIDDILVQLRKKALQTKKGEWIQGYGYDDTLLQDKRHPTRFDLDAVIPYHPVYIGHTSGHLAVVNTEALKLAGIDDNASDPPGGHYGRDASGGLNGVLFERARAPIQAILPKISVDDHVALLGKASQTYLAHGITTNTDANMGRLKGIEAYMKAARKGINPLRVRLMISHRLLKTDQHFGSMTAKELDEYLSEQSDKKVRLDSAKIFQDGSIQGLTGALRESYYHEPDLFGDLIHQQDNLNEIVLNLHKRGYRVAIHGNGDRAIGSILDAFEKAINEVPRSDHRHRIEHVQTATEQDIDRMKRLNVAGSFFINHVYYWGDRHKRLFLGPKRAERISPLADAVDRDLLFTLHSDCPVTPISPLFSVWAAVNRVTREGDVLGPSQKIDVENALRAMTIYGAKLNFEETYSGSIEVGKQADFAFLAVDPTSIDPMDIKDIPILRTIIGGKVVYENL